MKKIILTIFITLLATTLFASPTNDLISKIKNINSMSADFTQKLIDGQNNSNNNSKGIMSLKKPGDFKWVTKTPNNQQIVSNGAKLWIYDADLEQLIIKKVSNNIAQFPYLILLSKNANNLDKLFNIKEKSENTYILKPKDDEMINSITIKFDSSGELECLEISTSLHQYTQIKFDNVKMNTSNIKTEDFNFKTPKGTDVIDETKA
ncbi:MULTISPECIES: outer membrane lipoprotein chaperone LolA [Francisella]|uniref:Outer-membrane lipoprotein carrier protein n=1 Tax=Francisella adeliensis TaxID=2007306 RepID=A0A2Z4Y1A3_9GAMM|nr:MULTISPECIES: outer membrane lipoprotein chaperone LolA [Francisella]AXA34265.1 outer membrane lipoprotein carrier protein LolA [Francisella adeliensis]MBK2084906.1 outer membrane lipoprotein chaperone LolA [Francisella adeliensis]MBK2096263.1 outer membrane lipoprotein chaperone LolA [Francisella adeliensis]QIW12509.1 outer membrane lipoprotein chaperone LolA [Francisella adeliensis]QIW14382.1 outer membrane lipoprotein chaperone LolA [Francisella adeliensis]